MKRKIVKSILKVSCILVLALLITQMNEPSVSAKSSAVERFEEKKSRKNIFKDLDITKADTDKEELVDAENQEATEISSNLATMNSSQVVIFKDSNLEQAIRKELGILSGDITQADMGKLEQLFAWDEGIKDLTGLEFATNLKRLDLDYNEISDISALSNLIKLEELFLGDNQIKDISHLKNLINLQYLDLFENYIEDISVLKNLTNLKGLAIGDAPLDIMPLKNLTNLEELYIFFSEVTDISPISNLTELQVLSLSGNNVSDISGLKNLTKLKYLDLNDNNITDISVLKNFSKLYDVYIEENNITDISVLKGLNDLSYIYMEYNYIDLSEGSSSKEIIDAWLEKGVKLFYKNQNQSGINLNKTSIKIKVGQTASLKGTVYPLNSSQSLTWTSSNKEVATVNKNGLITARKNGTVYITATAADGKTTAFAEVKVIGSPKFKDTKADHWAYRQIQSLAYKNIINGSSDGNFKPGDNITRAQAAVMIVNAKGLKHEGKVAKFSDVPKDHWASGHIAAAQEAGIINGYKDGSFKPGEKITRAQIAVMIANAYDIKETGTKTNFKDVAAGSNEHWAYKQINILASNGIINGYSDGSFKPGEAATRAHFSVFLSNTIDRTN